MITHKFGCANRYTCYIDKYFRLSRKSVFMEENNIDEAIAFIQKFSFNSDIANKYPKDLFYYFLNSQFTKLKKETRNNLAKNYQIIISNSNHRELVFHGVYCVLTPKEYFLVKYF